MPKHKQEFAVGILIASRFACTNEFANCYPLELRSIQVRMTSLTAG